MYCYIHGYKKLFVKLFYYFQPEADPLGGKVILLFMNSEPLYSRIYKIVKRIPEGYVATYGQVASLAGLPGQARLVGYALNALKDGTRIPWHRVINAKGKISIRSTPGGDTYQRHLLEDEGILFDSNGTISLERFLWRPDECRQNILDTMNKY